MGYNPSKPELWIGLLLQGPAARQGRMDNSDQGSAPERKICAYHSFITRVRY